MTKKLRDKIILISIIIILFILSASFFKQFLLKKSHGLNPKTPIMLEIWHCYNSNQKIAFDRLVSEFNETVGFKKGIIVEAFSLGSLNQLTKKINTLSVSVDLYSKEIPDMFLSYPDNVFELDKIGLIADLDQYFSKDELKEYLPLYLEDCIINDKLKLIPISKSTDLLLLNKTDWDKFAENSDVNTSHLLTWETLKEVAKKYYEYTNAKSPRKYNGSAFFGGDSFINYMMIGSAQLDNPIFDTQNSITSINLNKECLKKLWDNFYTPYLCGYYANLGKVRLDAVRTGDLLAITCSTNLGAYFPTNVTNDDSSTYPIELEAFAPPNFKGYKPYAPKEGADFAVKKNDELHEFASITFLKWLSNSERNAKYNISYGYLPVKTATNKADFIQKQLKQIPESELPPSLYTTLPVSLNILNTYTLYSTKPFSGSYEAKDIIENSLMNKVLKDKEVFQAKLKTGEDFEKLLAEYDTYENFNSWYEEFANQLRNIVKN